MIAANFMHKNPVTIEINQTVRDLINLIFVKGVSGVPVIKNKKLVGIVTEEDILHRLFPTVKDVMEDYVHARSFDFLEENLAGLLDKKIDDIMTKPVTSVREDTPIVEALSLIILHKYSHIPVVTKNLEIIGMISQGDIFKKLTERIEKKS